MNIKYNRYAVFVGSLIWAVVAMASPLSIEHGIYTSWFVFSTIIDGLEISHHKIYNFSTEKIAQVHKRITMETVITCFVASIGYPRLAILGFCVLHYTKTPFRVAFVCGVLWLVYFIASLFIGGQPRWYGILLLAWSLIAYSMHVESLEFGHRKTQLHSVKMYTTIWGFRLLGQLVMNSIRWFVWCDCVFPYLIRWDIYFLGCGVTCVLMWAINLRKPTTILKFIKPLDTHMPAPDSETAMLCPICSSAQLTVDVEHGNMRSGFTFYENADVL